MPSRNPRRRDRGAEHGAGAEAAPEGKELVGKLVEVKWDGKGEWYEAKVLRHMLEVRARHAVRYTDDGVEQPEDLARMWYGRSWRLKKAAPPRKKEEAGAEERQLYEKILAEFEAPSSKEVDEVRAGAGMARPRV